MLFGHFSCAVISVWILDFVVAQKGNNLPPDLRKKLHSDIEIQVSYTGDPTNGFKDYNILEKDVVRNVPEFALGDNSYVSASTRYTVVLVDTTCNDTRKLYYARTNFKHWKEGGVRIKSETPTAMEYKAPGSFQEKGDERQYSFLLYVQPGVVGQTDKSSLKLPKEGEVFDVKKFQNDNELEDPGAGVVMVVKLGGETTCDGKLAPPRPSLSTYNKIPSGTAISAPSLTKSVTGGVTETPTGPASSANGNFSRPATLTLLLTGMTPDPTSASTARGSPGSPSTGSGSLLHLGQQNLFFIIALMGVASWAAW